MRRSLASLCLLLACQQPKAAPVAAAVVIVDAALPDSAAKEPFRTALAGVSIDETTKWLKDAGATPPPPSAQRALEALLDWDHQGGPFVLPCAVDQPLYLPILYVARTALAQAHGADDPEIHAVIRLGQALRDPANDPAAGLFGIQLAIEVADWLAKHKLPAPPTLTLSDALPRQIALAENSLSAARDPQAPGSHARRPPDALRAHPSARRGRSAGHRRSGRPRGVRRAFLPRGHAEPLNGPTSNADLGQILEDRRKNAIKIAKAFSVQAVPLVAFESAQRSLAQFRQLLPR